MTARETFKIAMRSLVASKLRSAQLARNRIDEQTRSLGAKVPMIFPKAASRDGVRREGVSRCSRVDDDPAAIQMWLPSIALAKMPRGGTQLQRRSESQ